MSSRRNTVGRTIRSACGYLAPPLPDGRGSENTTNRAATVRERRQTQPLPDGRGSDRGGVGPNRSLTVAALIGAVLDPTAP
jgi:hypothetical protein